MGSIDNMIQWFKDREGKVTYSMSDRLGPSSYDCSSAVYYSLISGGFLPVGSMGWTGTLHDIALPSIAKK
ncbi:peptidoglycan amidohydrolase family protein [Enterococcus casseliflavus]|nr:peptidoglycan amidohydrolase family protein [Enterococcus casseliflavus]